MKPILTGLMSLVLGALFSVSTALAGTEVKHRVVSLSPIITETIYLLKAEDQLIADTSYCNVPPAADQKEKIGSVIQMNVEKIISLGPDLVIASPLSRERQLALLKKNNIPVMRVQNPKTFDQMCDITRTIGQVMGKAAVAGEIITKARGQVAEILSRTRGLPKPRVFIQIGMKPLHSVNKESFINEYIRLGGGVNIAENEASGVFSREKVVAENPDIILIATMGSSKKSGETEKQRWKGFQILKASALNNIHVLDPEMICSPTPKTFARGLAVIARLIHPETKGFL